VKGAWRSVLRLLALVALSALALQLYFLLRVALMIWIDPQSTTFQRSEAWRLVTRTSGWKWQQQWVSYDRIAPSLKRAVIASEDAGFTDHSGVEWDAIEKAWERNQKMEAEAERHPQGARRGAVPPRAARVVGGSTISQQLAKNLFLGGERSFVRKGQEVVITEFLEALLAKERILEIYLDSVEWGEGVFGAEAAARHYFRVGAGGLAPAQSARLAVMLPAPKRFEKRPASPYLVGRAATVLARMGAVDIP
jgi:monofunctional biosynthetic peptidoglycan transglycosylase